MYRWLLIALLALPASGNEISWRSFQSGSPTGPTPLHDRGIHGQGQIIAILDTGLDYDNCYFAEPDNQPPPINTGFLTFGYQDDNVDMSRRKVVAYDFLLSCDQYPSLPNCENPQSPTAWDNQGHGTHAAASAAADRLPAVTHDFADSIAPAAKLIIQDAGFDPAGDNCSQLPALFCPISNLDDVLLLAWKQGARIHSNSWGDRQGVPPGLVPPTGNYSASARTVDEFVFSHPDMVVVFNTGNFIPTGPNTVSSPGSAKNTIQAGGTRRGTVDDDDNVVASFSGQGPTRDGRIKPDVLGPAWVRAADSDRNVTTGNCNVSLQGGTSWASPSIAGALALIRQYYVEGFYPSGVRFGNPLLPSAALMKATLLAAGRQVISLDPSPNPPPIPSYEQGFGFPVLDDALYFPGDLSRMRVFDFDATEGLFEGQSFEQTLTFRAGTRIKVMLVWTDPPGTVAGPTDPRPQLINDFDLTVRDPVGRDLRGNERLHPGESDRLNNAEMVQILTPLAGTHRINVRAHRLGQGPSGFALVILGDIQETATRRRPVRR